MLRVYRRMNTTDHSRLKTKQNPVRKSIVDRKEVEYRNYLFLIISHFSEI